MAKLVGLDIGAQSIKIVEVDSSASGSRLTAIGLGQTPPKGFASESQTDLDDLASAIQKVTSDAGVSTKLANVSLPESLVFTRIIEMPQLSEKELFTAIQWEAEQYIPLPLSEVILDHKIVEERLLRGTTQKMRVFLVAAPKSLVTKYQKVISQAGLELVSIETEVLALNRCLFIEQANLPATLVISIGAKNTTVFVSKAGSVVVTYVIPSGGDALTRAISTDLNISQMQAEEYKKTYGLKQEEQSGKIGKTVVPLIQNFVSELKRVITYYQSQEGGNDPIRQAILIGGTSKLPGLVAYFAQNLGIETQIGDPWVRVGQKDLLSKVASDPIIFSQAVGLSLKPIQQ
jgi:type IV pilus assembly protein PilM